MQGSSPLKSAFRNPAALWSFLVCSTLLLMLPASHVQAKEDFPRYPEIEKNIHFWEDIYSRYSTSQGVVHDSDDLSIIYEVIPIFNHRLPGASRINRPVFKGIKHKYSRILQQLAKGIPPQSREEKRVAALFGKSSRERLKRAAESVRVQIGQKDRFLEGVIRSGAYIGTIRRIFKKYGLPQDLAYLPHVESSFNLKAYSKFGASGIWQFTRSTGKQYLTINYEVDERQDPILASEAAARFLKDNYNLLGSWPLAITAYNYGPAGMLRAKKAHLSYENIFSNYEQGYFKFASRNFYSEFLAAVQVARKLEKSPSLTFDKPEKTLRITLPAYISASALCRHLKISMDTLKRSNPALRQSVLEGKKYIPRGYTLKIPFHTRQKALLSAIPGNLYHSKQKPTQFYRVRAGDTAGQIARNHHVSLRSLRRANNLSKNAVIFVGQNLRIPGRTPGTSNTSRKTSGARNSVTSSSTVPVLADIKKQKPVWKNIQRARSVVLGELSVHNIVKKGTLLQGSITILPNESLPLIADWLHVSPKELRRLNNLSQRQTLHPDEKLIILLKNVSAAQFEEKRFDFHLETEEDFFSVYKIIGVSSYTVQNGDTIWDICRKKFDLPLWLLKKYNVNLNFSKLRSSQQLTIPIVKAI